MRRYWILSFFLIGSLILLTACDSDQLTAPEFITDVTVSINGLDQDYTAPEGELIAAAFELEIRDMDGFPIGDIPAAIRVISGPGNVGTRDHYSTTDGLIPALFYAIAPLGDSTSVLMAIAGHDTAYATINIHGEIKPASIAFIGESDIISMEHFNQPASISASVLVVNKDAIPVPGIQVVFSTDNNSVAITSSAVTDEMGVASGEIDLDGRWFGEAEITAAVVGEYENTNTVHGLTNTVITSLLRKKIENHLPASPDDNQLIARKKINVELLGQVYLEFLSADTTIDYHQGIESVPISIQLRESGEHYFPNELIQLSTNISIGTLPHSIATDNEGIARADLALTGNPGSAQINASFGPLGLSARMSVEVTVESAFTASMEFTNPGAAVWINTTHVIRVAVRYLNGGPGFGIPVGLISALGNNTDETWATDQNGNVLIPFTPHNGGAEKLTLLVNGLENNDSELEFTVYAGEAHLEGTLEDGEGRERYTKKTFKFRMYDDLNQGITGERLDLSCSLGELNRNSIITGVEGRGEVILRKAGMSGLGTMYIEWKQKPFASFNYMFIGAPPASIELRTELNQLWVEGYDSSSTHLIASVYDETGSLINMPTPVVFEIVNGQNPPEGASFGNGSTVDSAVTSGGIAVVNLRAGRNIGGILLRVKTWRDEERTNEISILSSIFAIVAGPPHSADIDINSDAEDAGDGAWSLTASVRFWDIYRNPIDRPFPFYLRSPFDNHVDTTSVRTLNIVYNSVNTFDPFTIEIWTDEEYGWLHVEREFVFPLVDGLLELNVDPGNYMIEDDEDLENAIVRCWVVLTDGHQIRINNAPILFTTNRARFWWRDFATDEYEQFFPDPARMLTGLVNEHHNEEPGMATVYLREFVLDWWDPFTLELTVQVNACVEGYGDVQADPAFVFITRFAP